MSYVRDPDRLAMARREPTGRHQRPTTRSGRVEPVLAVALAQPHRRGLQTALAGYALGRLFLARALTGEQFSAGERYTRLLVRYMRHVTGGLPRFPSAMANCVAGDPGSSGADLADEDVLALRRDMGDALNALAESGDMDKAVRLLLRVCVLDRDLNHDHELGTLRVALNRLLRLWD
jgi:hypothetical protein